MKRTITITALLLLATTAHADPGPSAWTIPAPGDLTARVVVEADLTRHRILAPLTIAPDVTIGLSDRYGLLVRHSRGAEGRTGAGNGFCVMPPAETVNEPVPPCAEIQSGLGVTGLARAITRRDTEVSARVGITARHWSPLKLAAEVGGAARTERGRWYAVAAPALSIGFTSRGNRDKLYAPVYLGAALGDGEVHLRTGFEATLYTFLANWAVPIGAGASIAVRGVRIGGELTLDKAFGPLGSLSWRSANAYVETTLGGW